MSNEQLCVYEFSIGESFFSKVDDYQPYPGSVIDYYHEKSKENAEQLGIYGKEKQDAFRHTWTSADITYKHGQTVAKVLGNAQELQNNTQKPKKKIKIYGTMIKGESLAKVLKMLVSLEKNCPKL